MRVGKGASVGVLSGENFSLLFAMTLASTGAFTFFPYATTALSSFLDFCDAKAISSIAWGNLVGNGVAFVICLCVDEANLLTYLRIGYIGAFISIVSLLFRPANGMLAIFVLFSCMGLYRFSIGLSGNVSRAVQIKYLHDVSGKSKLISYIKLTSSVGGFFGPLIGSYVLTNDGFQGVIYTSATLFFSSLFVAFRIKPPRIPLGTTGKRLFDVWRILSSQSRATYALSFTAMIHFIFEAQIYTTMSINIQMGNSSYPKYIAALFSFNAIFLIILLLPIMSLVNRRRNKIPLVLLGSMMSVIGIVFSGYVHSIGAAAADAFIFTIGEIITPQIMFDLVTDLDDEKDVLPAISTFNFFTSALGTGIGYWLSSVVTTMGSEFGMACWILVYIVLVISLTFGQIFRSARPALQVAAE
jgi:MFS family permease